MLVKLTLQYSLTFNFYLSPDCGVFGTRSNNSIKNLLEQSENRERELQKELEMNVKKNRRNC